LIHNFSIYFSDKDRQTDTQAGRHHGSKHYATFSTGNKF